MAHFAELNDASQVVRVVSVANDAIVVDGVEQESAGIALLASLYGHNRWVQTSYNSTRRKRYASAGMTYNAALDAFIRQKPFPSWALDEQACDWVPPVPRPASGAFRWNEQGQAWVPVQLPSVSR